MDTQKSLLFKNEHRNDRNEQHESYIVPEVFQNCLVKVSDIPERLKLLLRVSCD